MDWPQVVQPYYDALVRDFGNPSFLHASFDDKAELELLLKKVEPTWPDSTRSFLADALLQWQSDARSLVSAGRRNARRLMYETLPGSGVSSGSLQDHYDNVTRQNPLALLPSLRKRKRSIDHEIDKGVRATEEAKQREVYALKLANIIQEAGLPVSCIVGSTANAPEAWKRIFGTRRSKTLINRYRAWSKFRIWLEISRGRTYPTCVADLIAYADEHFQASCGKTVLISFQVSLSVIEGVGRVPESSRLSQDATWMAQLRSYTAGLTAMSRPEQPASMLTTATVLALELFILSASEAVYLRALAFVCLLMVWGSLRADDVQGLLPQTMLLDDRGLSIDLARSKTTGPDKRTHIVKNFIERSVSLSGKDWMKTGFGLWDSYKYQRDYLVMKANSTFDSPIERPVSSSTICLYMRKVFSSLPTPKIDEGEWKFNMHRELFPGCISSHYTGRSPRNYLSSVGAAIGLDPKELDYLGRWKVGGEGSATYIRTSRQVVHRLQQQICRALLTGQPSPYVEVDSVKSLGQYASLMGESEAQVRRRHTILNARTGLSGKWPALAVADTEVAPASPGGDEEVIKPTTGKYFVVTSRKTGLRCLRMQGCHVRPENCHLVSFLEQVTAEDVDSICKDCRVRMRSQAGEEGSDPSSSEADSESTA